VNAEIGENNPLAVRVSGRLQLTIKTSALIANEIGVLMALLGLSLVSSSLLASCPLMTADTFSCPLFMYSV